MPDLPVTDTSTSDSPAAGGAESIRTGSFCRGIPRLDDRHRLAGRERP